MLLEPERDYDLGAELIWVFLFYFVILFFVLACFDRKSQARA